MPLTAAPLDEYRNRYYTTPANMWGDMLNHYKQFDIPSAKLRTLPEKPSIVFWASTQTASAEEREEKLQQIVTVISGGIQFYPVPKGYEREAALCALPACDTLRLSIVQQRQRETRSHISQGGATSMLPEFRTMVRLATAFEQPEEAEKVLDFILADTVRELCEWAGEDGLFNEQLNDILNVPLLEQKRVIPAHVLELVAH